MEDTTSQLIKKKGIIFEEASAEAALQSPPMSAVEDKPKGSKSRKEDGLKEKRSNGKETEENVYVLDHNRFPDKIRLLLDENVAPSAIKWLPEGDAVMLNKEVFSRLLLVRHFRGNKFTSVTRNFNRWGFRRIPEEKEPEGCLGYTHDSFRRDAPELIKTMKKEVYIKKEKDSDGDERPKKKAKTGKASPKHSRDDAEAKVDGDSFPPVRYGSGIGELGTSASLREMMSSSHDALAASRQLQLANMVSVDASSTLGGHSSLFSHQHGLTQLERLQRASLALPRPLSSLQQSRMAQLQPPGLLAPELHGLVSSNGNFSMDIANQEILRRLSLQRQVDLLQQEQLLRRESLGFPSGSSLAYEHLLSRRHSMLHRPLQAGIGSPMFGDVTSPFESSSARARLLLEQQRSRAAMLSDQQGELARRAYMNGQQVSTTETADMQRMRAAVASLRDEGREEAKR